MKSNMEYLRAELEGLNTGGILDEAIEFLDAIEDEHEDLGKYVKNAERERDDLQDKLDEVQEELNNVKEPAFEPENLQEEMAFEAFAKFLTRVGPMRAEQILDRLNKEPYLQPA